MSSAPANTGDVLKPYVPRLVIDWLRSTPYALHQEREATLVFVDISGFTALTERLAKKGKIGAELMRDTLDGVFRALLDEAYDWGAGLLKWGGDALLLFFDGPEHELRACRAAWEMQRTIDKVGRLHLTGGTLVLRMSVGIGTGTFHFFMTGSVHRELLIAGPAMTETLTMEAIADAGEIGITPALAAMLDRSCVGPPKDATILLAAPPEVDRRRAPDVGDVSMIDIASCIPVATRRHLLLQRSEPEHRTITSAFIDMMNTDELLAEVGPEALAVGLDQRIREIEEAALQFEVPFYETDVGKSSVKALLTAGAPSSTGHDEERMLRTLRAVMEQDGIVPMRIGVNTGKVFTGDFGPPYRRAYRVFGDAINTAARVMSKAEAGQILSTEIVLSRSRTIFDTKPIPPFAAKGKAEPVRASIVGPVVGMREDDRTVLPLIGRDGELQTLLDAVEAAEGGNGMLVEIIGESGIGKTRLLDEVVARSPTIRVLRTRGEEYESSTPYFAMRAIMRAALGLDPTAETSEATDRLRMIVDAVDPSLVPWIPLLGILLGLDLPPTPETAALDDRFLRDRLGEVSLTFLIRTVPGPTMVAVDDAQFLDESTKDLLGRLFRSGSGHRAMLVLTHQQSDRIIDVGGDEADRCLLVALGPLSDEGRLEVIEAITEDAPLRADAAETIAERSGGNPLFLLELLGAVRESGSVDSLPDSVEALIAGEIDQLAPADRTILRYASVLGTSFDPALVEEAVRGDLDLDAGTWERLSSLLTRDPDGSLRFENSLIRDAAYEGLPYRRRRVLHERVAETIEAIAGESVEEEVASLAIHYHEAQRWDKAWTYNLMAAGRAARVFANAEASRFFRMALGGGRHLRSVSAGELAAVYEKLADALYLLGQYPDADDALRAARRLLGMDPVDSAPLAVKQAIMTSRTGQLARTNARVTRALRALDGRRGRSATASRARLRVILGGTRHLQGHHHEAIRLARDAAREARRSGATDALAQAYKLLDNAYRALDDLTHAVYSPRALALYEELGDLRNQALILNNMGVFAQERSHWDEALGLYRRALELFDRTGDTVNACLAKYNIAEILTDQGRLDEAEPLLRDVTRIWRASGAEADVADARRELGKLLARRGDFEGALAMFELALATQRAGGEGDVLATLVRKAESETLAGDTERARSSLDQAVEVASRAEGGSIFLPMLRRLDAWLLLQGGHEGVAQSVFRAALESARKRHDDFEVVLLLDGLDTVALRRHADPIDVEPVAMERQTIMTKLGIVTMPSFSVVSVAEAIADRPPRRDP
ncbi:MAG TPA: tetratricopeptide repeat protein [Patescibacteria group bacterium]|nr:tetratricopeptide repeat protein [Patescibacteria group bacterium]